MYVTQVMSIKDQELLRAKNVAARAYWSSKKIISVYDGKLKSSLEVHYDKHVKMQKEWQPNTTLEDYKKDIQDVINNGNIYIYTNSRGIEMYGFAKGDIFVGMTKNGEILTCFKPDKTRYSSVEDYIRKTQKNVYILEGGSSYA